MGKSIYELLAGSTFAGGAPRGFNEHADVMQQAADGTDLNEFWDEVQAVLAERNRDRNRIINFLTFPAVDLTEQVGTPIEQDFEEASEYGQPVGIRTSTLNRLWRGYDFKFYDLGLRYTWMFLAEADRGELETLVDQALGADNRLIFKKVMKTLFNSINVIGVTDGNLPVTVYKFYNGDGEVPPPYSTYTHAGTHNHYLTTQGVATSATLTPAAVEALAAHLEHHGYSLLTGYRMVLWCNRQEIDVIKTWRVANGASWDFIPGQAYGGGVFLPQPQPQLVGQPRGELPNQVGTYGPWHVVQEDYVPAGYVVALASGGPDNIGNPIGFREHKNPGFRGLKIIPGQRSQYPLIDSFYRRGFGTGIRHRGAGVLLQVTGNASYTIPAAYV